MFQSIIIVDPRGEIKGKRNFDTLVLPQESESSRVVVTMGDIRDLLQWGKQTSYAGGSRIAIIEGLHNSSPSVPHALLKILEEPPSQLSIVATVDQLDSVLPTILSRCVVYQSHKLDDASLQALHLERKIINTPQHRHSWIEVSQYTTQKQASWVSSFIKSKQDLKGQLKYWQEQLITELGNQSGSAQIEALHQLKHLEEAARAANRQVLPRLVLHHLLVKSKRLR